VQTITFRELSRYTSQFANAIEDLGIKKGDRIAIFVDQSLEFYVGLFGALKRGAVAVPCSTLFGSEAMEYRLKDSNAKMLIISRKHLKAFDTSMVENIIEVEDLINYIKDEKTSYKYKTNVYDLAILQYTSGTTRKPISIPYRHKSLVNLVPAAVFGYGIRLEDRYFCPSPVAWGHGIWAGTMAPLMFGVTAHVYSGKFNPSVFLKALEDFEINNISIVPTALRKTLAKEDVSKYSLCIEKLSYTGEALGIKTFYRVKEAFGVEPHSIYGSTEVGVIILDYMYEDWEVKPGSLGKPILGLEVTVIDEFGNILPPNQVGEIAVKLRGKWVRTGDLGYVDEDGYFWFKGRADDVIKSSGYRIGPEEIESILNEHKAVEESAVIGVPDELRGQIIKAFIKLKPGYEPSEDLKRKIQLYAREKLAKYAYPREIEFIDKIPKSIDAKIKRGLLRQMEMKKRTRLLKETKV